MLNLLWKLIYLLDDNWGYSTAIQKRYKVGDYTTISNNRTTKNGHFDVGEIVQIVEFRRYDYLIKRVRDGVLLVVYQFELD